MNTLTDHETGILKFMEKRKATTSTQLLQHYGNKYTLCDLHKTMYRLTLNGWVHTDAFLNGQMCWQLSYKYFQYMEAIENEK